MSSTLLRHEIPMDAAAHIRSKKERSIRNDDSARWLGTYFIGVRRKVRLNFSSAKTPSAEKTEALANLCEFCIHRILFWYTLYTTVMMAQSISGAARTLLDREGVDGVTMRRVAMAVGITPMALYRHYSNRDGLLDALADAGFDELSARLADLRLTGSIDRQLLKILDVFLDYAFEYPRLFELMFLTKREGARRYPEDFRMRRSPTANVSADVIAHAMETGHLEKDDVWEIVFETGALMQGLIMLYVGGRVAMPPSEFRAFCHRSFRRYLNGIRA